MATTKRAEVADGQARSSTAGKKVVKKTGAPAPPGAGPACLETLAREGLEWAIPAIVDALVDKALLGSVAHLKLLMDLAGLVAGRGTKKKGRSVAQTLLDEWQQMRGGRETGTWTVVPANTNDGGEDDA